MVEAVSISYVSFVYKYFECVCVCEREREISRSITSQGKRDTLVSNVDGATSSESQNLLAQCSHPMHCIPVTLVRNGKQSKMIWSGLLEAI